MRLPPIMLALTTVGFAATACSAGGTPGPTATTNGAQTRAETMIAGEMATAIGLGPLTPTCNDPGALDIGVSFSCTAARTTQPPGDPIQITGIINPDGHLGLVTSNLISAAALPSFERQAASQLNESAGANFTAESVDCGNTSVVLGADKVLRCALTMPASGQVYDLDLAVTDLDGRHFALKVADAPRP